MLKEIFHDKMKTSKLYGKSFKRDWTAKVFRLLQILLTFGGRYNRQARIHTGFHRFTEIGHIFIINMFQESSISLVCF